VFHGDRTQSVGSEVGDVVVLVVDGVVVVELADTA